MRCRVSVSFSEEQNEEKIVVSASLTFIKKWLADFLFRLPIVLSTYICQKHKGEERRTETEANVLDVMHTWHTCAFLLYCGSNNSSIALKRKLTEEVEAAYSTPSDKARRIAYNWDENAVSCEFNWACIARSICFTYFQKVSCLRDNHGGIWDNLWSLRMVLIRIKHVKMLGKLFLALADITEMAALRNRIVYVRDPNWRATVLQLASTHLPGRFWSVRPWLAG